MCFATPQLQVASACLQSSSPMFCYFPTSPAEMSPGLAHRTGGSHQVTHCHCSWVPPAQDVSPNAGVHSTVSPPCFLWGQASQDISGQAGLRGGSHRRGKCSAEHLPAVLMQHPDAAALGVFSVISFASLLPNAPQGLHRWPSPSSLSSIEGHIPQVGALERDAGRAAAAMSFVGRCLSQTKTVSSVPTQGEVSAWHLGTDPRLPPAPACSRGHPHLTAPSPLSHGQRAPALPVAQPTLGHPCPATHPSTHWALPFSTRFKTQLQRSWEEPKDFSSLFFQPGTGVDLLSKNSWKWKAEGHRKHKLNTLLDVSESKLDPSRSTQGQL